MNDLARKYSSWYKFLREHGVDGVVILSFLAVLSFLVVSFLYALGNEWRNAIFWCVIALIQFVALVFHYKANRLSIRSAKRNNNS